MGNRTAIPRTPPMPTEEIINFKQNIKPKARRRGRPKKSDTPVEEVIDITERSVEQHRQAAEQSFEYFINLVSPDRVLGHVHIELINWMTGPEASTHQLVLLPRDHQKSAVAAYKVAWEITKNPAIRVLYISATANLATKQLNFIKSILTSDNYRTYWPEMVNKREADREKWTETEISIDHPRRKKEMIRDPTVFTAGLTTVIVGMHCDIAVLDDVVVGSNANTEEGRKKVKSQVSYLASIGGTDSRVLAVGTRYHPKDLYGWLREITVEIYDDEGVNVEDSYPLYQTFERQVESRGDGTGEFIWPRVLVGKRWFGFDKRILAQKKAQYESLTDFKAQYYNDPNAADEATINSEHFQYYDRNKLNLSGGNYTVGNRRLNIFAAIDFAFSLNKKADYTAIVVVGVDSENNYYVLDIDRFRSSIIAEYFNHLLVLHNKWKFRKVRAEVSVAQEVIVEDLKDNYIRRHNLALVVEKHRPTRNEGNKEERILNTLQSKYHNGQIWHYMGGNCELLEEELILSRPPHDDIKDALASAIAVAVPPSSSGFGSSRGGPMSGNNDNRAQMFHKRFGGFTG